MSYAEIIIPFRNYIDNILNNEFELLKNETNLLKKIYELLTKKINDNDIIFEFNDTRFHLHFENL